MTLPILGILNGVGSIVDDLVTTDQERREIALEERKLDVGLQQGQIDTNKVEAAHASTFVAGWRPAAGWVAAISLGMVYIPKALVMTAIWSYQAIVIVSAWAPPMAPPLVPEFPDLGVTDLIGLLLALLGLGGMRSWDKKQGTDTRVLGDARRVGPAANNEG
jgi:hypothetical protein